MREIKFRAWYPYKDEPEMVNDIWMDMKTGLVLADNDAIAERLFCDGIELMQFTDLLDKNGKEIYEGDVVECRNMVGTISMGIDNWLILDKTGNGFGGIGYETPYIEVIGNIYENPELLGESLTKG